MTRIALAIVLFLGSAGAAFAQAQPQSVASPFATRAEADSRTSLPPALPPRTDGVAPDLAFGAYQRGNFLYALLEAEKRLDANPKDAAAMTLIGEIYHEGAAARGNPIAQNRIAHLYVSGRALPHDLAKAAAWNSFAKAAGLQDQDLDVATAALTPDERRRFTQMVHEVAGF